MLTGIVTVLRLPPQCTCRRFLASPHPGIAEQLPKHASAHAGAGAAGGPCRPDGVTLDMDTTVHTLFGYQGGHKGCNPNYKDKKIYQPILTCLVETREHIGRRVAQRRSASRPGDRVASKRRVRSAAANTRRAGSISEGAQTEALHFRQQ